MYISKFWSLNDKKVLLIVGILAIIGFGIYSINIGQDTNWDLQNYHFYNPYAALNSRLKIDHNVSGFQTTLNPTLDILSTYPLLRYGNPILSTFVLGAFHGLNFLLLVAIFLQFFKYGEFFSSGWRYSLAILAGLLGVTGALSASEIGTTYGDLTLSVLNLTSILVLIRHREDWPSGRQIRNAALAGLIIGLSTGLKLTNAVYCLSFLAASAVIFGKSRFKLTLFSSLSAMFGIVIAHGWWSEVLWKIYGNPVFPLFNAFFKSPNYPTANFVDTKYYPVGWAQTLFYPFFFSWEKKYSHGLFTCELPFVDFRFPLAYLCCAIIIIYLVVRKIKDNNYKFSNKNVIFLTLFIVLSYVMWQMEFSIQRYAITIELLIPIFVFAVIVFIIPNFGKTVFILCAIFLFSTTIIPDWTHYKNDSRFFYVAKDHFPKQLLNNMDKSAIVLGVQALGWLVPSLNLKHAIWLGRPFDEYDREIAINKLRQRKSFYLITIDVPQEMTKSEETLRMYNFKPVDYSRCSKIGRYYVCRLIN